MVKHLTTAEFEKEVLQSDIPVLVDFWAPWCGPCRMIGPIMDELAEDYEGKAKICKVNVDEEAELAAQYKIASIPCVILFRDGEAVEKMVGARSRESYEDAIEG